MRVNGTVKFFNTAKGFGFIELDEGGKDVFVHATALEAAGISMLNEGDRVSFELEDDRRGRGKQAGQVIEARTGQEIDWELFNSITDGLTGVEEAAISESLTTLGRKELGSGLVVKFDHA
jgi:cold shock protein